MGIGYQAMLTGDRRGPAEAMAREIGIDHVEAELLPEQKRERVRQLASQGRMVAMVGDGINDAAALAAASVGIAVDCASDITAEAAGVVYMPHSLEKLPQLFEVSRRAVETAWLNIVLFAGVLNLLAVPACATGKLGPMGAALTHQLASLCGMMNALRLLRVEGGWSRPGAVLGKVLEIDWVRAALGLGELRSPGKHAPPMRCSPLEMAKPRVRAALGCTRRSLIPLACALVVLSGFYALGPDEEGVVERFGRKVTPSEEDRSGNGRRVTLQPGGSRVQSGRPGDPAAAIPGGDGGGFAFRFIYRFAPAVAVLLGALGVGVARKAGRSEGTVTPTVTDEDAITAAIYATMSAARTGDVSRYLSGYTGPMRAALQKSLDDSGGPAFARYLQGSDMGVKGLAVWVEVSGEPEAKARVERVYQDRNDVQVVYLEKESGAWRIAPTDGDRPVMAAIPYGTPIR